MIDAGSRLIFVRIRSGISNASSRGRVRMATGLAASTSTLMRSSTSRAKSADMLSSSKSMRAVRGFMSPPVTSAP